MKVLLLLGFDVDPGDFEHTLVEEVTRFVDAGGAERAAINLRSAGAEHDVLRDYDTERDASAMVELWEPSSLDDALRLGVDAGARLVGAYRVEEVVQRDYERTWPTGEVSPGIKLVCPIRRRPDLTHEAFSDHWRNRHGPLALERQPGFWHYVQNHIVERLTETSPELDGIGQLHYRNSEDVLTKTYDSEEGRRLIHEDVSRFLADPREHRSMTTLVAKERLIGG